MNAQLLHSPHLANRRLAPAYILLELIIALSIFSIAVLGLANSLSTSVEVSNILNRDNVVQIGMRSFIEELRKKPLADMSTSYTDTALGITYTSKMEQLGFKTQRGETLADLYELQVVATYTFGNEERTDNVRLYFPIRSQGGAPRLHVD
jgi:type II secretory pathway pseudopilin PulG